MVSQPSAARLGTLNIHRTWRPAHGPIRRCECTTRQLELLSKNDPAVYAALLGEEARERSGIELIPSENYAFRRCLQY